MAVVTIIVDTGGTGEYTSILAALNAKAADNNTGNDLEFICKASTGLEDTSAIDMVSGSWGVNPPNSVTIKADAGQEASFAGLNASKYRINDPSEEGANLRSVNFPVSIVSIQIAGSSGSGVFGQPPAGIKYTVSGCYISSSNGLVAAAAAGDWDVIGNVFFGDSGLASEGVYTQAGFTGTLNALRNTALNFDDGFERDDGVFNAVDNAIINCTDDFDGVFNTLDYNASEDGDGTNAVVITVPNDEFVNHSAGDLTLKGSSQLVGAGSTGNNMGADQDTGGSPARAITNIDGDNNIKPGQTNVAITTVGVTPPVSSVTLNGKALTITGTPTDVLTNVDIPTGLAVKWGRTDLDLVLTDATGPITLNNVTLSNRDGWETIDLASLHDVNNELGNPIQSYRTVALTDLAFTAAVGDQLQKEINAAETVDNQWIPTVDPAQDVTTTYAIYDDSLGVRTAEASVTWQDIDFAGVPPESRTSISKIADSLRAQGTYRNISTNGIVMEWLEESGVDYGQLTNMLFNYLEGLGYEGTINDKLSKWSQDP